MNALKTDVCLFNSGDISFSARANFRAQEQTSYRSPKKDRQQEDFVKSALSTTPNTKLSKAKELVAGIGTSLRSNLKNASVNEIYWLLYLNLLIQRVVKVQNITHQ